ncbi:hypothetical protein AVEN_155372-1 [Araneus ventricosus]|uniref:Uncharacterized protein n=1 Tax=Araneus ventricosus TaxID=182803 RepID=A0A4Y2MY87_ARAVE|nr:hypothetical protein AVEN_155372-1 [Araneus ventricosus]
MLDSIPQRLTQSRMTVVAVVTETVTDQRMTVVATVTETVTDQRMTVVAAVTETVTDQSRVMAGLIQMFANNAFVSNVPSTVYACKR